MGKDKDSIITRKEIKIGKFTIPLKRIIIFAAIILVLILVPLVLLNVFGNKESEVKPLYDKDNNPVYISEGNISDIYLNAENYKGQFIDISGQVFNNDTVDGMTILQIYSDVDNSDGNIFVYCNGCTDVKNDDYIKVTGYILGMTDYSNAFGGNISAPIIIATKLEKSTYMEVTRPTIKEVVYSDKVIDQSGYKIEVTKVEFAEKETRVYVTATNNAKADFSIYSSLAVATQDGKQYEQETNYNANYDELNSDLKSGITSSGIITFPPMKQKDFNVIIDGSSDDWDINIDEFNFNLEVK